MTYDRDEWRRPWTVDDVVESPGYATVTETRSIPPTSPASPSSPLPGQSYRPTSNAPSPSIPSSDGGRGMSSSESPYGEAGTSPPARLAPAPAAAAAPAAGRPRPRIVTIATTAFVSAVIGVIATLAVTGGFDSAPQPQPSTPAVSAPTVEVEADARGVVPAVAEAVTPSVVRIDVSAGGTGPIGNGAIGSGVIYRSDGYILTNHHVVQPALENDLDVTVRLASGDVVEAEIVGSDELNDLAVVRIDRDGLPAVSLRSSDEPLQVGETVVAIGSPFGLDASVTAGIISALNREIRVDEQFGAGLVIPSVIQTDAAINPGNSGGALVDDQGRLIGINTAILTRSGASQGVGFAVSVEQAISSADQLIADGFVRHPLLGVTGVDVTPEVADQFGLAASRGAVIESVQPDTGAADADLRPGDIIVAVDGEPLATMSQLVAEVRARAPGDVVVLTVVRAGEEIEVAVTLSERPR